MAAHQAPPSLGFSRQEHPFSTSKKAWEISYYCFPGGSDGKESACQCRRHEFDLWMGKIPWRRKCTPLQCSGLENPIREESGGLQSMGSQRVRQLTTKRACTHGFRKQGTGTLESLSDFHRHHSSFASHSPEGWGEGCALGENLWLKGATSMRITVIYGSRSSVVAHYFQRAAASW